MNIIKVLYADCPYCGKEHILKIIEKNNYNYNQIMGYCPIFKEIIVILGDAEIDAENSKRMLKAIEEKSKKIIKNRNFL